MNEEFMFCFLFIIKLLERPFVGFFCADHYGLSNSRDVLLSFLLLFWCSSGNNSSNSSLIISYLVISLFFLFLLADEGTTSFPFLSCCCGCKFVTSSSSLTMLFESAPIATSSIWKSYWKKSSVDWRLQANSAIESRWLLDYFPACFFLLTGFKS